MKNLLESELVSPLTQAASAAFQRRRASGFALQDEAETIVHTCRAMARRFHQGGALFTFGHGGSSTDAQHIAVEFAHPVLVGKRALPAIALTNDIATLTGLAHRAGWDEVFVHQLRHLARPRDIALGISADGHERNTLRGLEAAHDLGLLTVALTHRASALTRKAATVDHVLVVGAEDPAISKELQVTVYHLVWELVHVFFAQPGELGPGAGQ